MDLQNLHCQLLLYLDQRRFLFDMEKSCQNFIPDLMQKAINNFPPLRHFLEIDVMELYDKFPDLGEYLVKEPVKWRRMCSDVLFVCLQSLITDSELNVESEQVAVNLLLKSLPRPLFRSNPRKYTGLVSFEGLLLTISKPTNCVYHSVWSCPEECEGNEIILQYIPKALPKCRVCKSIMFENSGFRRCGEQVISTFKLQNKLLPKSFIIVDYLFSKLKLGSKYQIHAVVTKRATTVWSIEEIIRPPAPATTSIPADIDELFQECTALPWKFIYCLASTIGVHICPQSCFLHLKISLLLSLASVKANILTGSTIIHVLAAGYDTNYVGRLMEEGSKLTDGSIILGTLNTAASTALIASSGGVCVMPLPLHSYNRKQASVVLSSIETGEIPTDTNNVKLRTAVWAQGMDFKKMSLLNVASVFGTICRGDSGEYSEDIVDFVLQNAIDPVKMNKTKEEIEALKDIAVYIDLVAGMKVSLCENTERLLRNYFLAARKERPRGVSVGSMGALVATCVTSARLCRRTVASAEDAVFAIWLHVSGSPEPRFAPEEYLQTPADMRKLEKIMNNFKDWLEQFTGTFIS